MKQQGKQFAEFRHELVHGKNADFIAYQRNAGGRHWQTISSWMIPQRLCR